MQGKKVCSTFFGLTSKEVTGGRVVIILVSSHLQQSLHFAPTTILTTLRAVALSAGCYKTWVKMLETKNILSSALELTLSSEIPRLQESCYFQLIVLESGQANSTFGKQEKGFICSSLSTYNCKYYISVKSGRKRNMVYMKFNQLFKHILTCLRDRSCKFLIVPVGPSNITLVQPQCTLLLQYVKGHITHSILYKSASVQICKG